MSTIRCLRCDMIAAAKDSWACSVRNTACMLHKQHSIFSFLHIKHFSLAEIGQFCPLLVDGSYTTGQLFLHKVFGYRGVVLIPWKANLHDRDTSVASNDVDTPSFNSPSGNSRSTQYYQVLMDERDSPYVSNRIQTKAVTYLTSGNDSR